MLNLIIMVLKNREEEIEMPQQIASFTHHLMFVIFILLLSFHSKRDKKYEK